jgi:hypothetical protein
MRHSAILCCIALVFAKLDIARSFGVPLRCLGGRLPSLRADNGNDVDEEAKSPISDTNGPSRTDLSDIFAQPIDGPSSPTAFAAAAAATQGGDEKLTTIQKNIADRVAALKKEQQWSDGPDVFGKDPLATQPIWLTMAAQIKVCKPFDSVEELATTYFLLLGTTTFLTTYLLVLRDTFDGFIVWFTTTDFDNEFLSMLFNQS